jgi:hypothetical protein
MADIVHALWQEGSALDDQDVESVKDALKNMRTDNLGHNTIVYFPSVPFETPSKDEGEEEDITILQIMDNEDWFREMPIRPLLKLVDETIAEYNKASTANPDVLYNTRSKLFDISKRAKISSSNVVDNTLVLDDIDSWTDLSNDLHEYLGDK